MTGIVAPVPLRFQVGARTLFAVRRRLVQVALSLAEALAAGETGTLPSLPPLDGSGQGYLLTSVPEGITPRVPGLRIWERQRYVRHHADLTIGFDAWATALSAKTRGNLLRKERRFAAAGSGGAIDLRVARTPAEMTRFFAAARAVSRLTYQERLLDAGLPDRIEPLLALAARDAARGFLLCLDDAPVSYLYLPADGDTLRYAHLGHDPAFAALSPGSVLQLGAMRALMAERRFAILDFTEGAGQHKRAFATGGIACRDLLLLRPTIANRATATALGVFDAGTARFRGMTALRRRMAR